jgi:hypothetical protein
VPARPAAAPAATLATRPVPVGTPPAEARAPSDDPQADRVILLPTAYTHPKGTFYFSSYDVVFLQAGYALTDATQATLTALPVPNESVSIVDLSLKSAVYRGALVRVAAIGSASGAVGKNVGVVFLGRAGGVVQLCLERACDSSFSVSTNLALAGQVLMVNGVGGIWRVGRRVSFLGELATALPVGKPGSQAAVLDGAALGAGVRLEFPHVGFDFAIARALGSNGPGAVVPFLTFTYRSAPG